MVVALPADAIAAFDQSRVNPEIIATAFYGADQTIPSAKYPGFDRVPILTDQNGGSLTWDRSGQTQGTGSVYLAAAGASLVPKSFTDPLAPFGQELNFVYILRYGGEEWSIPLGRFRIGEVPSAKEYFRRFPSKRIQGWEANLNLIDRFDILTADSFLAAASPTPGNTTKQEVVALAAHSGLVVSWPDSIPDAVIPTSLVYQSGRLDAITQLLSNVNCEPAMTRQGSLTLRLQNAWLTATAADSVATINGTIDVTDGMSMAIYNSVVVTNPTDSTVLAVAEITDPSNPLCVTGPLGRRVYTNANPLATSDTAPSFAQTILARVSTQQSKVARITCLPRPDIELGDIVTVIDTLADRTLIGEVTQMTLQLDPTASMTLQVTVSEDS